MPEEALREKAANEHGEDAVSGPSVRFEISNLSLRSSSVRQMQRDHTQQRMTMRSTEDTVHPDQEEQQAEEVKKGMILPFRPLCLTFHNVCYYVDMPPVNNFLHLIQHIVKNRIKR